MKIGDKVRFLNEIGGGIVSGFQDKFTVLVEDEDGFEMPTLISDCVVIDTDNYNISKVNTIFDDKEGTPKTKKTKKIVEEEPEPIITFKPRPQERNGADTINAYLAFVPESTEEQENPNFDIYFVNDSNYYFSFAFFSSNGTYWNSRFVGTSEPNTKLFIETIERLKLQELERISIQIIAYKENKPFALKPSLNVELRLDATKFYKLHALHCNDFFDEASMLVDVVRDDKPVRTVFVDANHLQEAIIGKCKKEDKPRVQPARKEKKDGNIVIDLHAAELLDSVEGLEPKDIMDCQLKKFNEVMQEHLKEKNCKIVFIHGKGNGVLRNEVLKELRYRYKNCTSQDASFCEYGFGATLVTIK